MEGYIGCNPKGLKQDIFLTSSSYSYTMADVRVFSCRRKNLPPVLEPSEDALGALNDVLEELIAFVDTYGPARVVWDLADNNLTFEHVQHIADKLSPVCRAKVPQPFRLAKLRAKLGESLAKPRTFVIFSRSSGVMQRKGS